MRGEVIGTNTAMLTRGGEGHSGIGCAVPASVVRALVRQAARAVRARILAFVAASRQSDRSSDVENPLLV